MGGDVKMATFEKIIEVAEGLGWRVETYEDSVEFHKFSPADRAFGFSVAEVEPEAVINGVNDYIDGFDVSYETYIWLDSSGHGVNGAPHDMEDVLADTNAIYEMLEDLYSTLEDLL